MQTARNVAIVMLLALVVAVVPGGDAAADTILVAISMLATWILANRFGRAPIELENP